MANLVALAMPGGPAFVDALRRTWDAGDAAFPLDLRLPPPARERVLSAMAPGAVVDEEGRHPRPGGRPVDDGDALVVTTSGTTGEPKGVVLTHDAVRASALATSERLAVDPAMDGWLACLPLAHVGGLSVVTRALVTGTRLTVLPGFDADAVMRATADGCTLVSLVATALARVDPSRFRWVVLGGSRPPEDRPPNCVTTYGMTETGSGVVYDGVPLAGVDVRIDDGEVLLRGPMLLRAYRDGTDPKDDGGWLATGDLGRWLPDGRLHVDGRRGDLIISGGENVWPEAVEAVLAGHPRIADVAVAGVPDREWGQRVVAFVVPVAGDATPSLDDVRAWAKEHLPAFAAPRQLVLVDHVPRTNLGKVSRAQLVAPEH
jgi:o-succinylbenzoate---CoA ligase